MTRFVFEDLATEENIHKTIIHWANLHVDLSRLMIHCPNEGKRSKRFGKLLRDLGMKPGVADLFLALPNHDYHGLWVEIKSSGGTVSLFQKQFLLDMACQQYFTAVVWSAEEGIDLIKWYTGRGLWVNYAEKDQKHYRTMAQIGLN